MRPVETEPPAVGETAPIPEIEAEVLFVQDQVRVPVPPEGTVAGPERLAAGEAGPSLVSEPFEQDGSPPP
jgi:hypothetical protein